jgi:hypothetical protein
MLLEREIEMASEAMEVRRERPQEGALGVVGVGDRRLDEPRLEMNSLAFTSSRDDCNPTSFPFIPSSHHNKPHATNSRLYSRMDRSLDEIISERPVRQRHPASLRCTIADYSSSSAVVAAAAAVDVDPTDALLLLLPEDLAETKAPETASER